MPAPGELDSTLLALAAGLAGLAVALQVHTLRVARRLERRLGAEDRLRTVEAALEKLAEREAAIDLRRTEHVLLDVREAVGKLEERLLSIAESRARAALERPGAELVVAPEGTAAASVVTDRILARLLALGYERIRIVTDGPDLARLASEEGDVIVEARRDGALCKGRVRVAQGLVGAVLVQPAYSAFP
ncbi:MAG: hypothetical protein JNK02_12880 [Planctomycetes bacterium]|nr:hypothetical protein [Planctomycetota bacterium]